MGNQVKPLPRAKNLRVACVGQFGMTVWEDLMNCICQNAPQRPGMQEVLDSLERHTVCTGTQCFEDEADAFGITAAPNGTASNQTTFFMFMMFLMMIAFFMRMQKPASSAASKPGSSNSHSNEPPPPATES